MLIKTPQVNSGIMQVRVVLNLGNIHFVYEWSILTFSKRQLSHTSLFLSCLSKDHVLIICKSVWEEQRIHKHVLAKILVVLFHSTYIWSAWENIGAKFPSVSSSITILLNKLQNLQNVFLVTCCPVVASHRTQKQPSPPWH